MLENCHNRPSWWSPGPTSATTCDSNMWRSGGDIGNGFGGALSEAHQWFGKNNLSVQHPWGAVPISRPGCWGYPDMMEIGNFCKDGPGKNQQCYNEEESHFGLWCIMSSPLVLGFNMSNQDQMGRVWPIITNKEAIAVDHAWAGMPGTLYSTLQNGTVEIWAKALPERQVAFLVLNTAVVAEEGGAGGGGGGGGGSGGAGGGGGSGGTTTIKLSLADDLPGKPDAATPTVRDVWNYKDVATQDGEISITLATHQSFFGVVGNVTDEHWWRTT